MNAHDRLLSIALRRKSLQPLYRLALRNRDRWALLVAATVFVIFTAVLVVAHRPLTHYLAGLEPAATYQLATAVGAALIGLIAVVFTLTLFVIQQISVTNIPDLLREYASDTPIQIIYAVLAGAVLFALSATFVSPSKHPFSPVLMVLLAILVSLTILWALFDRVATLADPAKVITHIEARALRELETLEVLRRGLLAQNPTLEAELNNINGDPNNIPEALAAMRGKFPQLTNRMERSLRQLYTLDRRFAVEESHELLRASLQGTTTVLAKYLEYHGTNIPAANTATVMMGLDIGEDRILSEALFVYADVASTATPKKDTELARAALRNLSQLAFLSVSNRPLLTSPGENGNTLLIFGKFLEATQEYLRAGHSEAVFSAFALVEPIIVRLVEYKYYVTAGFLIQRTAEIVDSCLAVGQPLIAAEGCGAILRILAKLLLNAQYQLAGIPETCYRELVRICNVQLQVEPPAPKGPSFDIGMGHPISRIFGPDATTFVSIYATSVRLALDHAREYSTREFERQWAFLDHVHEKLPIHLSSLAERSSGKQHMLLYWLETAALTIAREMLRLWYGLTQLAHDTTVLPAPDDRVRRAQRASDAVRLSKELGTFITFFYSRANTYRPKGIVDSSVADAYNSVVSLATDAAHLGANEVAKNAIDTLSSYSKSSLRDLEYAAIAPVADTLGHLLETAMVAHKRHNEQVEILVLNVVKTFYLKALVLSAEQRANHAGSHDDPGYLLLRNLRRFSSEPDTFMFADKSRTFATSVNQAGVVEYIELLEKRFSEWLAEFNGAQAGATQS